MLDPGRYLAEAIYFLQYTLAQILWAVDRALLTIAVIAEGVNAWLSDNVGYFVELLVNALEAPLGGLLILALTALGAWYALNTIVATSRWVDPSKLLIYGFLALSFFSAPLVAVDLMESLRTALLAGVDEALIDGAAGDIFSAGMDGTDGGLPPGVPDVNGDGVLGSFDLATAFMHVANIDELDSSEFPADFEATYFPFGDPSSIDLSDEADQQLAKALAADGIERLVFALVAIPTAISEHFLRLALTAVAVLLYAGAPFAMLLAFFVYTQAFLGAYIRQFANLLIETFLSVIIAAMMIGLLAAAAQQGVGLYIAASLIACFVLLWRIKSALRLASAAFDLFGGGMITGGSGGMEMATMGRQAAMGAAGLAGAALTGGATVAVGAGVMGAAAALQADGQRDGAYLGTDPAKTENRVAQLRTIAGYTLGRSETVRGAIEGVHEVRTLGRNLRDGAVQDHAPDALDYLRAGSSMSGFGSSPWLAMRVSPSLRGAFDEIGGRRAWSAGHPLAYDELEGGAPVVANGGRPAPQQLHDYLVGLQQVLADFTQAMAQSGLIGQPGDTAGQSGADPSPPPGTSLPGPAPARTDAGRGERDEGGRQVGRGAGEANRAQSVRGAQERRGGGEAGGDQEARGVQDVRIVERALDLDHDGREDKYEENRATPGTLPGGPDAPLGAVVLQLQEAARQQVVQETVAALQEVGSPAGRAAYGTLQTYAGADNAALIRAAVSGHGAPAVQDAAAAVTAMAGRYRQEGLNDAQLLAAFQSGEAATALREVMETPLNDEQLAAVADMVLLPRRRLTRAELATAVGRQVAAGNPTDEAVAEAVGSPVHFGRQTGNVRGVIAGAEAMRLAPEDLARLAELIRLGEWERAQTDLAERGHPPAVVHSFIADLAALPEVMAVPQTTASQATAQQAAAQQAAAQRAAERSAGEVTDEIPGEGAEEA